MTLILPVFLLASAAAGTAATTVSYRVDTSLIQVDSFSRPSAILEDQIAADSARGLGLRRLQLAIDFHTGEYGQLSLVFRPDAINRDSDPAQAPTREVDTRAGETYRPSPSLRLLDTYQLRVIRGQSFDFALGVWQGLAVEDVGLQDPLAFGLETRLPSKFAGGQLQWKDQISSCFFSARLQVFQGDEDRTESLDKKNGQLEFAPVARDPHQAAALFLELSKKQEWSIAAIGGFGESTEQGGRRAEQFIQIFSQVKTELSGKNIDLTIDARRSEESWNNTTIKIAPRLQQSIIVTSTYGIYGNYAFIIGAGLGSSEHAKDNQVLDLVRTYNGWQVKAGYQAELNQGLIVKAIIDIERRRLRLPNEGDLGGFVDGNSRRSTNRRIGLEINYNLHGNT